MVHDLILRMISKDPKNRPPAKMIELHPFFWEKDKCLRFLVSVSNKMEKFKLCQETKTCPKAIFHVEHEATRSDLSPIFHPKCGWGSVLPSELKENLSEKRYYNHFSIIALLRAIRNKHNHFADCPDEIKELFGKFSSKFSRNLNDKDVSYVKFWMVKYPSLVIKIWRIFMKLQGSLEHYYPIFENFHYCSEEASLEETSGETVDWPENLKQAYQRHQQKMQKIQTEKAQRKISEEKLEEELQNQKDKWIPNHMKIKRNTSNQSLPIHSNNTSRQSSLSRKSSKEGTTDKTENQNWRQQSNSTNISNNNNNSILNREKDQKIETNAVKNVIVKDQKNEPNNQKLLTNVIFDQVPTIHEPEQPESTRKDNNSFEQPSDSPTKKKKPNRRGKRKSQKRAEEMARIQQQQEEDNLKTENVSKNPSDNSTFEYIDPAIVAVKRDITSTQ